MERDFMGLSSKDSAITVKEEAVEGGKDSAFFKGPAGQLPLSNTFDPTNKHQLGEIQKKNHSRQGGTQFSMTTYPMQQNVHSVHLPHDVKMLPGSNQAISVTKSNAFFKTHFSGAGQNFVGAPMKQQLLGGVPITAPHSIFPSIGSVAGSTEPWFNSKVSRAPAQLTIFYAGTVNVFDDISPEKAQAIMFLAGNGSSTAPSVAPPRAQIQTPTSKMAAEDVALSNQPMNTPPGSGLSSPMSVSSHPVGQSGGGSTTKDGPTKTTGGLTTPVSKVDGTKIASSLGPVVATTMIPSAVPQARKASLARFLEKRKERVMNATPYNLNKKSDECTTPGSNGVGSSASSGVISGSFAIGKEISH